MDNGEPKIVSADRIDGGIQIVFSNGREGFYDHSLLYEIIDRAPLPPMPASLQEDE